MLDPDVVAEGARLTAIGMVTAFGLLLLLIFVIVAVGRIVGFAERRSRERAQPVPDEAPADVRDKALAAVVAVSALMRQGEQAGDSAPPSTARMPNNHHV